MSGTKFSLAFLIYLICLTSCSSISNSSKHVTQDKLIGEWVHSHEESLEKEKVFRPSTYDFPLSRGRDKIHLKKNNALIFSTSGPDDRPVNYEGEWLVSDNRLTLHYNGKQLTYKIVDVSTSILKLQ